MNISLEQLNWFGRTFDYEGARYFDYSASGFSFKFEGTKAVATVLSDPQHFAKTEKGVLGIFVKHADGTETLTKAVLLKKENQITLFEADKKEKVEIKVMRFSEAFYGYSGLAGLEIEGKLISTPKNKGALKLEVIGDSITCGYGIEGVFGKDIFDTRQERPDLAYAYLTAQALNADYHLISRSGIGLISCYTDPATVKLPSVKEPLMSQLWPYTDRYLSERLKLEPQIWDESKFSPDIVIFHIGTNDTSWVRGLEDRRLSFVNLYKQMLEAIHRRSPNAKILCCLGAMGQDLCASVQQAIKEFGKTFPSVQTKFVKFPVQDEAKDGVVTDWHPSAKTHKKIAAKLVKAIEEW